MLENSQARFIPVAVRAKLVTIEQPRDIRFGKHWVSNFVECRTELDLRPPFDDVDRWRRRE